MDNNQKEKIKKLFSDWNLLIDERKGINADISMLLKKDEEYQKLLEEKKAFEKQLQERKEIVAQDLIVQKNNITENIKLIVSDVKEDLDVKTPIVNNIFKFYKKKFDHGVDDLDTITVKYLEIFEDENN